MELFLLPETDSACNVSVWVYGEGAGIHFGDVAGTGDCDYYSLYGRFAVFLGHRARTTGPYNGGSASTSQLNDRARFGPHGRK